MASYVLDTHACLYALQNPARLGKRSRLALAQVDAGRGEAWVPAAVVAEIVLLRERGRTTVGIPQLREAFGSTNWAFLPLDLEQLDVFGTLAAWLTRSICSLSLQRGAQARSS